MPSKIGGASAGDAPGGSTSSSVTYELFLREAAEARRIAEATAEDGISGAEARIAALEKALGGGEGVGAPGSGFGDKGGVSTVVLL